MLHEERDQEETSDSTVRIDSTSLMGEECASVGVQCAAFLCILCECVCGKVCMCVFYCNTDKSSWKLIRKMVNKFS